MDRILTCLSATYVRILTCRQSTTASAMASFRAATLLYHSSYDESDASVAGLSPHTLSAQNAIRPVSCYALFKWWLLLSQHPGCLWNSTSFYT